jgi:hypothetical protein
LKTIYSFQQRNVRGTENASYHSYGLALDLIPTSYERKYANWIWSTAFIDDWHLIPLEQRWSPPQAVIDAFEENGFVWGGKWVHFDAIHFEYAPEIILLAHLKDNSIKMNPFPTPYKPVFLKCIYNCLRWTPPLF